MSLQKNKMSLWFNEFVFDNEDILFASGSFNGLFRADIDSGKASLINVFPGEDFFSCHLYSGIIKYGDYILFIPGWAKNFAVYDVKQQGFLNVFSELRLVAELNAEYSFAYYSNILVGKHAYVFGYGQPEILRIDMESFEVIRYDGWIDKLYKFGKREGFPFFYRDVCLVGESLFLVTAQNNSVVELNMKTDQIHIHPIGMNGCYYNTIAYDGISFWMTEQTKGFLKVNARDWGHQYIKVNDLPQTDCFFRSVTINGNVWLLSNRDDNIFQIHCEDSSFHELKMIFGDSDKWNPRSVKRGCQFIKKICDEKIVVFCTQDCQIHIFESGKDVKKVKFYTENEDIIEKVYKNNIFDVWKSTCCVREQDRMYVGLKDFLYILWRIEVSDEEKTLDCGKKIYAFLNE